MSVIGIVGLPGSGKGEAAALARERGLAVVTMGDVIREACRERGLDPASHHGEIARTLREEEGPTAIAERSIPEIRNAREDSAVVLVDGLRSDDELDRFESAFGEAFSLVAIEAPFETRAERIETRGRDDTATETLRAREERELSFGMGEAIERAEYTIANDGSLAAFRERVEALLDRAVTEHPGRRPETDGGSVIYRVTVEIEVPVHPTEVGDRVAEAVLELFSNATVERRPEGIHAEAHSLETFAERLREQEILEAARSTFSEGRKANGFDFTVKKQAATEGIINFVVDEPGELGEIDVRVTVHEPDVEEYIDHVAPPTEEGEPIDHP